MSIFLLGMLPMAPQSIPCRLLQLPKPLLLIVNPSPTDSLQLQLNETDPRRIFLNQQMEFPIFKEKKTNQKESKSTAC